MNSLYLLLDIGTIFFPLALSFNAKGHFYKRWKSALTAITSVGLFFILWDIWFTKIGVWGFNSAYLLGLDIANLPIEEWLFFICIPYACLFLYDQLIVLNKSAKWLNLNVLEGVIALVCIGFLITGFGKLYTTSVSALTLVLLVIFRVLNPQNRPTFYLAYGIILIPFTLINGVLTGFTTASPVVWYNNQENLQRRFGSIPVEDFIYYFLLFGLCYVVFEGIKKATQ